MEKVKFKKIFDFQKKSKIKAGDGFKLGEAQYPFYTSSNVLTKSIDEYLFEDESLIFGTGGLASIHFCDEKFAVSTDCFVTQPKDKSEVFSKFVYYYLSGNMRVLENGFKGAGLKHISKDYLENIEIPLPNLPTQQKIAAILDKADELRQYNQQLIEKYEALTQSLFLDMFGDPVKNEKGWEIKRVIDYCDCIVPGRDKPKSFTGQIPWVTTDDLIHLGNTYNSKKNIGLTESEILNVRAKKIPIDSVIMSCVGNLGVITINKNEIIINQQLHAFQCHDKLNNVFLMNCLSYMKSYMYKMSSSTTVPYMNKTVCNNIPIIIPPIALQNQFAERIQLIETQKQQAQEALAKSEALFQGLLQQAFKGELG
jgi:type I restriction enzyme S subunit